MGPLFKLLLDATTFYLRLPEPERRILIPPVDVFLGSLPIPYYRVKSIRGHTRRPDRDLTDATLTMSLNPNVSRKRLLRAIDGLLTTVTREHRGKRRWIRGAGVSPVLAVEHEDPWINIRVSLDYTRTSLKEAVRRGLEGLRNNSSRTAPRRRMDQYLILALWVFYRRRTDPGISAKNMAAELEERHRLRGVYPWTIDRILSRFRERSIPSRTPIFWERRRDKIDSWLRPTSPPR